MSRINTNVESLIAQNSLNQQNNALNTSLQRLSTGLQINSAADNPAGLIASENFQDQLAGTTQAIANAQQADSVMGTADAALDQVNSLLTNLQTLVTQTANSGGLSSTQIAANQAQVNSILGSIDRIATTTQFGGKNLLNGTLGYTTTGVSGANIQTLSVNSAQGVSAGSPMAVQVAVTTAATHGAVTFVSTPATGLAGAANAQITGNLGTQTIALTQHETVAQMVTAINAVKTSTGVSATDVVAGTLVLSSQGLGASQFVSVSSSNPGNFATNVASANGADPAVTINGNAAGVSGMNVTYNSPVLSVNLSLTSAFAGAIGNTTFNVTGGGATFQIGSSASLSNQVNVGIGSVATGSLGNATDGFLSSLASGGANSLSGGNAIQAQTIVNDAISQVSNLRGQIGSFETFTLNPTINSLQVSFQNISSANSNIEDTDFSSETSNLTRAQILSQAATSVLSMANSQPQNVLSLLKNA